MKLISIQRAIILEDELMAANELGRMLKSHYREVAIEAVLPSVKDAIAWLQSHKEPDVIFCDIVLNDGLCFNIFEKVDISCPIVFCTGFDEYLMKSFSNNGVDYLLKPIKPVDLENILKKLENFSPLLTHSNSSVDYLLKPIKPVDLGAILKGLERIRPILNRLNDQYNEIHGLMKRSDAFYPDTILCYFRDQIIPIPTDSIKYISIEDRVVYVYTDEKPYTINNSLDELMSTLNPYHFFRFNRKYIIRRNAIQSITKTLDRKLNVKLILPGSPTISIGKERTSEFKKWLEGGKV